MGDTRYSRPHDRLDTPSRVGLSIARAQAAGQVGMAWVLSGLALLAPCLLLVCLEAPGSAPAQNLGQWIPIPDIHAARYGFLLDQAAQGPAGARPGLYAQARLEALSELAVAPMKADAWMRLAFVNATRAGRFDAATMAALQHSYVLCPIDPTVALWRIRFSLEAWEQLTPQLRQAVIQELSAIWRLNGSQGRIVQSVLATKNSAGRLAALLVLNSFGWRLPAATQGGHIG